MGAARSFPSLRQARLGLCSPGAGSGHDLSAGCGQHATEAAGRAALAFVKGAASVTFLALACRMIFTARGPRRQAQGLVQVLGQANARLDRPSLMHILAFVLPALGPDGAAKARTLLREASQALDASCIQGVSRSGAWENFFDMHAPPMLALINSTEANAQNISRAAALTRLRPQASQKALWAPDKRGRPPLVVAAQRRDCFVLHALLDARAQPGARDTTGWTALMWASQRGDVKSCRVLLHHGANVNDVARDGSSALLCGTRADAGQLRIVQLLLLSLADPALVPIQGAVADHLDIDVHRALLESRRAHAAAGRSR